ncbi:hypothetical protein KIN20_022333 [Parelaphostrongylus tenuis]|uniref:Uncharacterized protein n=1 Tax=Parelaphostrongylus tenuis TaxID=148309 RepID=A0AAD5QS68_PARTN|nr:hypothetical protein KIN20_022333 [Parelaphostrongylus tenuis]
MRVQHVGQLVTSCSIGVLVLADVLPRHGLRLASVMLQQATAIENESRAERIAKCAGFNPAFGRKQAK